MRSKTPSQLSAGSALCLTDIPFLASKSLRVFFAGMAIVAMGCVPAFAAGAATTTTLVMTSNGTTVASGGTVVLPAKVTLTASVLAGATPVTKGTVKFCVSTATVCSDINLIGTAQLTAAGTASFTFVPPITPPNTATPPVTTPHSYTAVFLPTTADLGSNSAASTLYVTGTFPTSSVLTSVQTAANPPPYIYTLTDTVTASTQAYPTGTVTFYDTSDVLTPGSAGPPVVPPVYLELGTAPIVAGSSKFVLNAQPVVPSSNLPRYVAVGDLNGDGIPDIAVSDFGINPTTNTSTVDIYFGNGDGTFTAGPLLHVSAGNGPQFTVLGDFNNDGCLDVITESYTANSLYLFLNTKTAGVCTGTFGAVKTITNAAIFGPGGIGIGDFNGDGNLDIVVANNSSASTNPSTGTTSNIFFGDGTGNFTLNGNLTPGGTINPQFFAIGDYNGDGFLDIAVANNVTDTINIYLNSGTGTFTLKQTLATTAGNIIILPADVNKDGKIDLVVSTSSTTAPLNVWTGNGDGTFTAAANPPATGASYSSVAVADFNGDGDVDIITTTNPNNGTDGNVSVLLGNGNGTFQAPTATQSDEGLDTLSLAVGDFNGDGYADVALANFSSNNLAIYTAGYQTTGTATANLPGVTLYGATVNPHLADAVFPTNTIYTTSTSNTVPLIPNILPGTAPSETLTMTATPVTTDFGQQIALQATFTYINLGPSFQPNGETVTFYQVAANGNLTSLGTATLGTVANPGCSTVTAGSPSVTTTTCTSTILNTTTLPIGTDKLEVSYNLVAPPALPAAPATSGANVNFTGLISPTINVTVGQVSGSADTVTANPNPTSYGTPDVLTFCIPVGTGVNLGANVPSGTVQFSYGTPATNINAPVTIGTTPTTVNGTSCYVATTTTTALPTGNDTVTATFTPGANSGYGAGAPTAAVTVAKAPITNPTTPGLSQTFTATTNPATNPTTATAGTTPVILTYTIPVVTGNTAPTGPVVFTNGGTTLGTCTTFVAGTLVAATGATPAYTPYRCAVTTTALPVGNPDTVTATYTSNDPNYAGGAPALTAPVIVNAATGAAVLTAAPNPATVGSPVTLTETVAPIGGVCPAGPTTFLNNGVSIGTGTITLTGGSCVATLVTSTLPLGTDPITATIPASGPFAAITSGPVNVVVNKIPGTGDALTTAPNPSTFGQPVTLTETIPTVNGLVPTGTVTFYYPSGTAIGTGTVTAGVATLTTSTLPVGTDPITAIYGGDGNYAQVTSGPVNQVVNTATAGATLAAGPNPATFGTPVTITETLVPVNGQCPPGPVSFFSNGTSIGTGTLNASCVATITTSTLPVGSDAITATAPAGGSFGPTTSGPVALVINKANGPDTLASSPNPSTFGQSVAITDTIPIINGVAPTGTVNFYDFGTLIGTGTVNAQGVATLNTTTLPVGTDSLTATYLGDGNYAQVTAGPVNQVVSAVSTTATLAVGPNPTTFGTAVTATETIPIVGGTPATGTVTFSQNGTVIGTGTLNAQGVASLTTTTLPVGTDPITATYPGNTNYAAVNSGPVNEVVNKANGPDTLAANPDPAVFGTTVTLTDTVPTVGGVAPTGTVTFTNNGTTIGTAPIVNGVATLTTTTLPVGSDPISGAYSGDGNYAPVTTGPVNEVITTGNTTPVLAASPNPTTFGTTVNLTESVPGVNGVTPTGTVKFYDNGTLIGTAPLQNGVATLPTSTLPIGTDPITATYSGDGNYATANSGPLNVVINKAAPADTVTAAPTPTTTGTPVTLTFTVPLVNGVPPTGVVTFYNGTTSIGTGTVNAAGVATLVTSSLPLGTDTITAKYPGDNTYAPASPTTSVTINAVTGGDTVTVNPSPTVFGSPATVTLCIPVVAGAAAPTGTVTFTAGGVTLNTTPITIASTPSNGCYLATVTTTNLPVGAPTTVTATFTAGPTSGYGSGAPTTTVTVAPVNPISTVTYGPSSPSCAATIVTLTDTITPVNGVVPQGTVQFYTSAGPIGTPQPVVNGVATLQTTLPCGITGIYAIFTGLSPYGTSTAPTVPVNLADFTIAAKPPTQTVNPGDTAVYTVNLAGAGGVAFTSPVTLTATGLPPGATVSFGTATYVPGVGPTPTSMTIVTSPTVAMVKPTRGGSDIYYGLLLLPLLGIRRIRRKIRALPKGIAYGLAALALLAGLGAMTGCQGGYFGGPPHTYVITVTGTSGTLSHSTTVTLTVE